MDALLIELGWKSALIAGAALTGNWSMRRRAAAERVLLLRIALAMLLLLSGLVLLVPAFEVALLPPPEVTPSAPGAAELAAMRTIVPANSAPDAPPLLDIFGILYAAGAALVLVHFAAGIITLWRWTRAAHPVEDRQRADAFARGTFGLRRSARLRVSASVATPLSWGVAPAWILIGPELERTPSKAEAVVAHELAHVRRLDWLVLVGSRLATALYWCNPLIWMLDHALIREAEFAADDVAVRHVAPADYAQTLLAVAAPSGHYPACDMAVGHGTLARRIRHLLEERAPTREPAALRRIAARHSRSGSATRRCPRRARPSIRADAC